MASEIDLSCPNGCFELEISGGHATRDDVEFLEDVAIDDRGDGKCPQCGDTIPYVDDQGRGDGHQDGDSA